MKIAVSMQFTAVPHADFMLKGTRCGDKQIHIDINDWIRTTNEIRRLTGMMIVACIFNPRNDEHYRPINRDDNFITLEAI